MWNWNRKESNAIWNCDIHCLEPSEQTLDQSYCSPHHTLCKGSAFSTKMSVLESIQMLSPLSCSSTKQMIWHRAAAHKTFEWLMNDAILKDSFSSSRHCVFQFHTSIIVGLVSKQTSLSFQAMYYYWHCDE